MLKRLIALVPIAALALVLPATGSAGFGGHDQAAKKLAHAQCKSEKKADRAAFRATYGKHPMKTCVREALPEVEEEYGNATDECRAEREADTDAFRETYGSNRADHPQSRGHKRNAFGRCVSQKVHEDGDEEGLEPTSEEGGEA